MRGPYKCPVGWTRWAPVGNTAIKTYLEADLVTTTDSNTITISFYFWILFHSIKNSDVFFEGAISMFSPNEEILAKKYLPVTYGTLSVHLVPENGTQSSLLVFHISKSTEYLRQLDI